MEKEIEVNGKKFKIRELLATEMDKILENKDTTVTLKNQITLATGITDDEYSKLTVKEKMAILLVFNQLNGLTDDFQKSLKIE